MRTYTLRVFLSLVAAFVLVFATTAVAQDDTELPQTQAECDAAGYMWFADGAWDIPTFTAQCVDLAPADETPAVPTPTEPAQSARLPQSQPAPAQQGAPQYTG